MPAQRAAYHTHPRNVRDLPIFGLKLEAGDTLEPTDVYDSTSGRWEPCPCPGLTLLDNGVATVWIRPVPVPPERELVSIGGVYTERGALPPEPASDENLET